MASLKAIKRRIGSVKNIQKIMKAMKLVATSKLQKQRERLRGAQGAFEETQRFFEQGVGSDAAYQTVYYTERDEIKRSAYVVIAGERGLCGSYNANVLKAALAHMDGRNEIIFAVGSRCADFFVRRRKNVVESHAGVLEGFIYPVAEQIAHTLTRLFESEDPEKCVDEVFLVFTSFKSVLSNEPKVVRLLPIVPPSGTTTIQEESVFDLEVPMFMKIAVRMHLAEYLNYAMLESSVSEQASRMTGMDTASRNASDIVDDLTLEFNRKRQSSITQEINEIVSGANAL